MRGLKKGLIVSICLLLINICYSQQKSFIRYTTENGLSSDRVYALIQGSQGNIWLGTDAGLSKFDGNRFTNYTTRDGLSGQEIIHLYLDDDSKIWLKSFNQVPSFIENGKISGKNNYPPLGGIKTAARTKSFKHYRDSIWITHPDTLYLLTDNIVRRIPVITDSLSNLERVTLRISTIKPDGSLILTSNNGLLHFKNDSLKYFLKWPNGQVINSFHHLNEFLLIRHEGIFRIVDSTEIPMYLFPPEFKSGSRSGMKRLEFEGGHLWIICNNGGVFKLNEKGSGYSLEEYLPRYHVTDIIEDKDGNLWFSTFDNGLFKQPPSRAISYIKGKELRQVSQTLLVHPTRGLIIGGAFGSIYQIDSQSVFKTLGTIGNGREQSASISALHYTDTSIFAGTYSAGIHSYNFLKKEIIRLYQNGFRVRDILQVGNTRYFIYNYAILKVSDSFTVRETIPVKETILSAAVNQNGHLFIGTVSGLYRLTSNSLVPFRHDIEGLTERINQLQFTAKGHMVVGTATRGLILIKGQKISSYTTTDGLVDNFCSAITCVDDTIWYGSNSGLNKIILDDFGSQKIIKYDKNNGLISNKINNIAVYRDKIWISTDKGLCRIPSGYEPQITPILFMDSLEVSGGVYTVSEPLHFNSDQNNITFKAKCIYFGNPEDITYEYKLLGKEFEWIASKNPSIAYYDLSPGDYSFKIRINLDGSTINSETKTVHFTIRAHFWQNPWFIAIAPFMVLGFFVLIIRLTILFVKNSEQKKFAIKERIARSELTALQSQMNPHFIFNALHSIDTYIQNSQTRDASIYLKKFAKLTRLVLQSSTSNFIDVDKEVELLNYYMELEQLRFEDKFSYTIECDRQLIDLEEKIPSMLIQPLVENAIKHAFNGIKKGLISISFKVSGERILVVVEDNGIGINQSKRTSKNLIVDHQSIGLTNVLDRINVLNEAGIENITLRITDLKTLNKDGTRIELSWKRQDE